jgi:methionyl-tRNA formyltransferase
MKIAVIGTSELTLSCAQILIDQECIVSALVSLPNNNLPDNSVNIKEFSLLNNIPYFETSDINLNISIDYLEELKVDFILSTWPHIIFNRVIGIPKYGVIGTHPTQLPKAKGRHPLHWMIVLGISNSSMSFFKMDETIDGGNILIQEPFILGDNINSANNNMIEAANNGLINLIMILKENPNYSGAKQETNIGNFWRRRDIYDITIDPRMSSSAIIRIVNSFCYPYPLARLYIDYNKYIGIVSASKLNSESLANDWKNYEYGYIFKVVENEIYMRVDDSIIKINVNSCNVDIDSLCGKRIHPPAFYNNDNILSNK